MKRIKVPASLIALIKRLKRSKKRNSVTKRYNGKYNKHVYLKEDVHKIADLVAITEGLSIKTATDLLVMEG